MYAVAWSKKLIDYIINKKINLTEENILEKLLDRRRWPKKYPHPDNQPTVEAIAKDGKAHQNFFNEDGYLESLECIKCYEEGYTLILSNVGEISEDLWKIQQHLNKVFNKHINCNLYFGNGKRSVSFDKHNHDYAVIVKNIYGKSKWVIDDKEVILKDQECIWFDKFINHQVVEIESAKLSLTCNIDV